MMNIYRITHVTYMYSLGPLIPIIPIFSKTDELGSYISIKHLHCEIKYFDSLYLKNCYLEIDHKDKFRPVIGSPGVKRINEKKYNSFDTNKISYIKGNGFVDMYFSLWFDIKTEVKESAVLYFDSVYVNNKLVSIPPLSLKKEYVFYFDEESHKGI